MNLPPIIKQVDQAMMGWPDEALTLLLLGLAGVIVFIALFGPRWIKPVAAAWVIAP